MATPDVVASPSVPIGIIGRAVSLVERRWVAVVALLGLAASFGAAGVAALSDSSSSFYDEHDYVTLGTNIADGIGYSLDGQSATAFRPPGFPAVLSIVALVQPHLSSLRIANALLAGVVVVLGAALVRTLAGSLEAVIAAVLLTASPIALYTATKVYPQTFAAVLLLTAVIAVLRVERSEQSRARYGWAVLAGVSLSALTLTVPNHGITIVVAAAWLLWRLRARVVPVLAVLAVVVALPIGAWALRNYATFDAVVPVSSNGGLNLLLGNTDGAGAGTGTMVDISEHQAEAHRRGYDEVETDDYYRDQAVEWITDDPVRAARLYSAKVLNTFAVEQELATADQQPSTATTVLVAVTYLPVLLLFLVRPALTRIAPWRRGEMLVIGIFWANVFATALAFTRIRFRVPLDPLMVAIVAVLLGAALRSFLARAPGTAPSTSPIAAPVDAPVP